MDILVFYCLCHLLGSKNMTRIVFIDETLIPRNFPFSARNRLPGWVCASADAIASDRLRQPKRAVYLHSFKHSETDLLTAIIHKKKMEYLLFY